jgi:inosine triphosphate pyrophosphatase
MKLTLITGNKGKLSEWQRLLPPEFVIESLDIDLDEIQSLDAREILTDKVKRAYQAARKPVVVEDVSAGLDKLGGLPGPFIKFFLKKMGSNALYKLAGGEGERAVVVCTIAYYDGQEILIAEGKTEGTIVSARGDDGFGFDQTFMPHGDTKTYAEMTAQEKDTVSHRSKAIKMLVEELKNHE